MNALLFKACLRSFYKDFFCDNKSIIALAKNPFFHGRIKNIDIKFHYICELVKYKITFKLCSFENQIINIFKKSTKHCSN